MRAALLGLAALLSLLAAPAATADTVPACNCRDHLKVIERSLANARELKSRYERIAETLDAELAEHLDIKRTQTRFWELQAVVGAGITPPDPQTGVEQVAYVPAGLKLFPEAPKDPEAEMQKRGLTNDDLCAPQDKAFFDKIERSASCRGLVELTRAHEMAHLKSCRETGFFGLWFVVSGADLAREEIASYDLEIAGLEAMLARAEARCKPGPGFVVRDDLQLTIKIPELTVCPAVDGSETDFVPVSTTATLIVEPVLFPLVFTPSGPSQGRYSFDSDFVHSDVAASYMRHWGNGRYDVQIMRTEPGSGFPSMAFLNVHPAAECSYYIGKVMYRKPKPADQVSLSHNVLLPELPDERCFGEVQHLEPDPATDRSHPIALEEAPDVCLPAATLE